MRDERRERRERGSYRDQPLEGGGEEPLVAQHWMLLEPGQ